MKVRISSSEKGDKGFLLPFVFALSILCIQSGFTYYFSIQIASLIFLLGILLNTGAALRVTPLLLAVFTLFLTQLFITAALLPETISTNSSNILVTMIGILVYVSGMLGLVSFRSVRPHMLLVIFGRTSAAVIGLVVTFVVVTDLNLLPHLTREYFILQNIDLVTNYTTLDVLIQDFSARKAIGVQPDIDLFYGEQSFLSLVLFVCLVCQIITSRALNNLNVLAGAQGQAIPQRLFMSLIVSGLGCMVYIQSFSSLFYAFILIIAMLSNRLAQQDRIRLSLANVAVVAIVIGAGMWVVMDSLPYYLHRIVTFSSSISAQQRFGILLNFLPQDYVFGLHNAERLPVFGFQNGAIYLVMMGGAGGFAVLFYLLWKVFLIAQPLRLGTLSALAVLAIFSQSGGIFSPNKLVIISLIIIPLSSSCSLLGLKKRLAF